MMIISTALKFGAATSDRVSTPNSSVIQQNESSIFTVIVWFQLTTFTANRRIVSKNGADGAGGLDVFLNGTTELLIRNSRSVANAQIITSDAALVLNQPYCLMITHDTADTLFFTSYLGTLVQPLRKLNVASGQNGSGTTTSTAPFVWGNQASASPTQALQCLMWGGALFMRHLRLAEGHQWQRNLFVPGAVLLQRHGANGPSRVIDESGYGHNGAITGALLTMANLPLSVSGPQRYWDVGTVVTGKPWHYYAQMRGAA